MQNEELNTSGTTHTETEGQQEAVTSTEATTAAVTETATDEQQSNAATGEQEGQTAQSEEETTSYDITSPEGLEVADEVLTAFKDVVNDLKLSKEAAQQVMDKMAPVLAQRQQTAFESMQTEWKQQVVADKEIGGDGIEEKLSVAKKALDAFGTPELTQLLVKSGLGNNPEVIRTFYRVGKSISEDKIVTGGTSTKGETDPAKILFPSMK